MSASDDRQPEPDGTPAGEAFGRYVLVDELGRGAAGIVYRAYHVELRRYCAIKMLHARLTSEKAIARFVKEGQSSAKLGKHPNIIQVFDAGVVDDVPYMAMELIAGHSIGTIVEQRGKLPEQEVLELGRKTALALDHAHRRGIVHRDIKPENMLVDDEGEPQLLDFGLAKDLEEASEMSQAGTVLGTPAFMAPEQADPRGLPVDHRADVYSLGAALYHMLTGYMPFRTSSIMDTIVAVLTTTPPKLSSLVSVSRDLEAIIERAMEKEPRDRYQTALEMADDLSRVLAGEVPRTRPVGPLGRAMRKLRRHPWTAALVASFVLVAGIGGAWAAYRQSEGEELQRQLTNQISGATADEVRALLEPALPLLQEQLALARSGLLVTDELETLARYLTTRLRYRPRLDWLSWGDAKGRFAGATRPPDGTLLMQRSWPEGDTIRMVEEAVADDLTRSPVRSSDEWDYDPRVRPFYTLAEAHRSVVWTEPYEWWEGKGLGITACAALRSGPRDTLVGVFTVDFRLADISEFLAGLEIGRSGEAFLLTRAGKVLAGPRPGDFKDAPPTVAAALEALPTELAKLTAEEAVATDFELAGEAYLASAEVFRIAGGLEWASLVVVPAAEITGSSSAVFRWILIIGGSLAGIALLVVFITGMRRRRQARDAVQRGR